MEEFCRLCYSGKPLVVSLLDETDNILMKISACLPIKISREDVLSKLICTQCCNKVDEFYQFCLTTLDVEKRLLKSAHESGDIKKDKMVKRKNKETSSEEPLFRSNFLAIATNEDEKLLELDLIKDEKDEINIVNESFNETKLARENLKLEETVLDNYEQNDLADDTSECLNEDSFPIIKHRKKDKKKNIKSKVNGSQMKKMFKTEICNDKNVLSQELEYDCCICFFKCKGKDKMLDHYRRHNKASSRYYNHPTKATNENGVVIELFECNLCKSVFKNRKEFLSHYAMHRSNNGYRCSLCDKAFSTVTDILEHGLTHNYDKLNKDNEGDVDKPKTLKLDPSEMRFLCELCDAKFNFFKSAKDHRVFDHPENKDPFLVRCIMCKEKFSTYWMIRKHLRSHREKLKSLCTICGKYLSNNHKLNMHLRIHLGFKPFVCSVCSKAFVNSSRLKEHERVHSGDKPYKCECGKKFTQRSSLVIHMRSHSGDRPYTCNLCHRGFISRGLLTVHQKTTCI